jgi:hypothetical protein
MVCVAVACACAQAGPDDCQLVLVYRAATAQSITPPPRLKAGCLQCHCNKVSQHVLLGRMKMLRLPYCMSE